ncbi:unnamed protein product [Ectocarpus sp. 8 AP-2014]
MRGPSACRAERDNHPLELDLVRPPGASAREGERLAAVERGRRHERYPLRRARTR